MATHLVFKPQLAAPIHPIRTPRFPAAWGEASLNPIRPDTRGQVDILVSGVGTGGRITGVSRFIPGQE